MVNWTDPLYEIDTVIGDQTGLMIHWSKRVDDP